MSKSSQKTKVEYKELIYRKCKVPKLMNQYKCITSKCTKKTIKDCRRPKNIKICNQNRGENYCRNKNVLGVTQHYLSYIADKINFLLWYETIEKEPLIHGYIAGRIYKNKILGQRILYINIICSQHKMGSALLRKAEDVAIKNKISLIALHAANRKLINIYARYGYKRLKDACKRTKNYVKENVNSIYKPSLDIAEMDSMFDNGRYVLEEKSKNMNKIRLFLNPDSGYWMTKCLKSNKYTKTKKDLRISNQKSGSSIHRRSSRRKNTMINIGSIVHVSGEKFGIPNKVFKCKISNKDGGKYTLHCDQDNSQFDLKKNEIARFINAHKTKTEKRRRSPVAIRAKKTREKPKTKNRRKLPIKIENKRKHVNGDVKQIKSKWSNNLHIKNAIIAILYAKKYKTKLTKAHVARYLQSKIGLPSSTFNTILAKSQQNKQSHYYIAEEPKQAKQIVKRFSNLIRPFRILRNLSHKTNKK